MKKYINKFKFDIMILIAFLIFILFSYILKFACGLSIKNNFLQFLTEMASFIPLMFILIGLFDVWVPKEKIEKYINKDSGIIGTILIISLAMLQAGPLYGAFPTAYILWKKGCSVRNIFIYLGAFSTLKLPMIGFEIGFLGFKFSLLRTLITLPIFILIGIIMEYFFENKDFEIKNPMK